MDVSLVIPGRNAAATLRRCLDSVAPLLRQGELREVLFVDDGSTDETAAIAAEYPVRLVRTGGLGPGGARNLGWRAARGKAVWFIDADCVPEPDALRLLKQHLDTPGVAGVGGSYANIRGESLLPSLIHEEIRERHLAMTGTVDYLGSFNVLYRREVLERIGGFDERHFNAPGAPGGEDADLSYRISDLGLALHFEPLALVGHHHPVRLAGYLRSQRLHGGWGVRLYARHPRRARGNSYSSWADHVQPPLAVVLLMALPTLLFPATRLLAPALALALTALQLPMTARLIRRTGRWRYLLFVPMSVVRAVARGVGLVQGTVRLLWDRPAPVARSA